MTFIAIDTTTNLCSAALLSDGQVIDYHSDINANHSAVLAPFIQQLLQTAHSLSLNIDAIALSSGPGSYTGLRIGAATAKGLCYSMDIPLIEIPTMQLIAIQILAEHKAQESQDDVLICPMIDARRMEVYCQLFDKQLHATTDLQAKIIDADSFSQELKEHTIIFVGNGADKCSSTIVSPKAVFIKDIKPDTKNAWHLILERYQKQQFTNLAYFEPNYLKEYHAIKSKNKVLTNMGND